MHIDLSTQAMTVVHPPASVYHERLGGRGLAGYFFASYLNNNDTDPICVFTGPLNGTPAPSSGHVSIGFRSPLTGGYACYTSGGSFGNALKRAGVDGLVIEGASENWVGLQIQGGAVTFVDAADAIYIPHTSLFNQLKVNGAVMAIGEAGARGAAIASVVVDGGIVGAGAGGGAQFGKRRLKYICVEGGLATAVHDADGVDRSCENIRRLIHATTYLTGEMGFSQFGSTAMVDLAHARNLIPNDNFRGHAFDYVQNFNASAIPVAPKTTLCAGCSVNCTRLEDDDAPQLDYGALVSLMPLINNDSLEYARRAYSICVQQGLEPQAAAFALAAYQEVTSKSLDGDEILQFLKEMANGVGTGALLAHGAVKYANACREPGAAMCVKSQPVGAYDPREALGLALSLAVSTRGGFHAAWMAVGNEILGKPVLLDRRTFSGKARIVKMQEDYTGIWESLVVCQIPAISVGLQEYLELLQAVTGVDEYVTSIVEVAERICYQERVLNYQLGIDGRSDTLPDRFFLSQEGNSHPPIDSESFDEARKRYYRIRQLDSAGNPVKEHALALGITWKN